MDSTSPGRWLSVVGLGEDGWDGLPPVARALVERAAWLIGGARHLSLVPPVAGQERCPWPSPLTDSFPALLARRGTPVCVLASGDPSWYGVAATLLRVVPAEETTVIPAPSAFSLAAARLGWPVQDTACLTVHGRPLELVIPHLQPNARLLILSWDGTTPAKLAALLRARGFGGSRLTALEAMGGPREARTAATADGWTVERVADLNTLAVACVADPGARSLPRAPGLPDDWFAHDGQITKREVRAVTLSALAPRRGERLWDVGAGSGSIGIEWMLADPANQAIAVEHREDRVARILSNAAAFGVPGLEVARGKAPELPVRPCRPRRGVHRRRGQQRGRARRLLGRVETGWAAGRQRGHAGKRGGAVRRPRPARRRAVADRGQPRGAGRRFPGLASADAGHAVAGGQAMIVAGLGCRRGCGWEEIAGLIATAFDEAALEPRARAAVLLAAPAMKREEPGIAKAARALGLTLAFVDEDAMVAAQPRATTRSATVLAAVGLASVAEAAALAAAGPGSRLLVPRRATPRATVAIAVSESRS